MKNNGNKVLFAIGDFEVTARELLVSVMIVAMFSASSFFIRGCISNKGADIRHELSVTTDVENARNFEWVRETGHGLFAGFDTLVAVSPVSIDDVEGMAVERVLEKYTMHTRTSCNKNGCHTTTYWTWDRKESDFVSSKHVSFFGMEDSEFINVIPDVEYVKTESCGYHLRYKYYRVPVRIPGVMNGGVYNEKFKDLEFSGSFGSIKEWREFQTKKYDIIDTIFIVLWTILCMGSVIAFCANSWYELEND